MLDTLHIPNPDANVQIFTNTLTTLNAQWQTWIKPRGIAMVSIFCMGGGGGGGGGFSGASATDRGGGGGGGSSGQVVITLPGFLLPDKLWMTIGTGGAGGAAGASGGSASARSVVLIQQNSAGSTIPNNIVVASAPSAGSAGGGGAGTGAAGGAGGSFADLTGASDMNWCGESIFVAVQGQTGAAGGAQTGADGGAATIPVTSVLSQGGHGGAGVGTSQTEFAGGSTAPITDSWLSEQRAAAPATGSFNGSGGPQIWKPFFSFSGCGGSSSDAGVGGSGGNGAYGAGGGGGGGGTTGGRGGNGGTGILIFTCW